MYIENSRRLHVDMVPKSKFAIRLYHLHDHNDPDRSKRKSISRSGRRQYMTVCRIIERDTGEEVAQGHAVCSKKDTPVRALGHGIALGRALKEFYTYFYGSGPEVYGEVVVPIRR